MSSRASRFIEIANVQQLKDKLAEIGLATNGLKSALKIRLQQGITQFDESQLEELFPAVEIIDDENSEESSHLEEENRLVLQQLDSLRLIVARKEEIRQLQIKLAELSQHGETNNSIFSFRDFEDSLPTFSGDDNFPVMKWIKSIEESKLIYKFDDAKCFIYAQRLLKGTAKLFLRSVSCRSWNELKTALISEFQQDTTASDVHNTLRSRRKRKDESNQQYVLIMQEIASSADIEEQDIINYIIKGIPDTMSNKQILLTANSIADLKRILKKYDKMKTTEFQPTSSSYKTVTIDTKTSAPNTISRGKVRCFNCNDYGHVLTSCPKPRREKGSCFRCGQMGHMIKNCPQSAVCVLDDLDIAEQQHRSTFLEDFHGIFKYTFISDESEPVTSKLEAKTLIDTGSPINFIQQQYLPPYLMTSIDSAMHDYVGINNSKMIIFGKVYCNIEINNFNFKNICLYVVKKDTMKNIVILGREFLQKSNLKFSLGDTNLSSLQNDCREVCDFNEEILNIDTFDCRDDKITLKINENLSLEEKNRIRDLAFGNVSYTRVFNELNENEIKMRIILTNTNSVFNCAPRRLPHAHKVELQKISDDLLEKKIIRESNSPYASPIVLAKKKSGELRLCIDFRQLNKITLKNNFPIPLIEDLLDGLRGKHYFSLLDLKSGFQHVQMEEESIKYTSFVTPLGQFEYLVVPCGLKNGPAVFQQFIEQTFKNLIRSGKLRVYFDDLLVATETKDDHFQILHEVFSIAHQFNLEFRFDKCIFMHETITYLGYEVSLSGIRPNADGIRAVREYPIPSNLKALHSFLGLCSYFRKFVRDFSIIAKPLYDILKKDAKFVFGKEELHAFETLKNKLIDSPVLSIYNPSAETELHCDASNLGFGAVLLQRQEDKMFHPIFFFSKRATLQESKYHSYELETLAIIYALRRFNIYLTGIKFKIVTDCKSLTLTLNKKVLNPRISRWALELQEYDYSIEHRDGRKMTHVDALSRVHNVLMVVEADSFENALAASQQRDKTIQRLVKMLEERESSVYELVNGLVYRKINQKICFYVPLQMERSVIQTHHEALCHVGVEKCYDFLKQTYWFPLMKAKIKNYIGSCLKCMHFSPPTGKKEGVLHNIPKGDKPFDTIHVDHYGPLPCSVRNAKKHVLVVVDAFSKFTKLYPVKTTNTKEVIKSLETYFSNYSKPLRIISDRGSCFTSDEFLDFCKNNCIQHIKIATGSPQSNGQVERINRSLTPMLAKESELDPGDWTKHLSKVEFALNNYENKSTGFTPSTLLFGIRQRGDIHDNICEYLQNHVFEKDSRDLKTIRKEAHEKTVRSQEANKVYFDKHHKKPYPYKIGDYVLIKNVINTPGVNKKLMAKFKGPFEIIKTLPNDRYLIRDLENLQISRKPYEGVASPENMKPYLS